MRANHSRSVLLQGKSAAVAGEPAPKLEMTSLVDMMAILVVFLLMSFSADDQMITPAAGLQLPSSNSDSPAGQGLVVEVGFEEVLVDGRNIMPSKALSSLDSAGMDSLTKALKAAVGESIQEKILIQADRRVQYNSLSQVLRACADAGLSNVSLVVLGGGS